MFFLTTINLWHLNDHPKAFALVWTYPCINFVVVSYTVSSQWVYDLVTLRYGVDALGRNRQQIRRHMKVFSIAVVVFVTIVYFVYLLDLPTQDDLSDFENVFYGLAIFQWITAAILSCSACLYVKQIVLMNRTYGKAIIYECCIFLTSTTIAGGYNYWLGTGGIFTLIDAHLNNSLAFATFTISYFTLSEYIPALAFAHTVHVF
jgi:hypothetical protein